MLLGYPPFLKDVIDTGLAARLDWPRYTIKLVMAGEVFSEEWRDAGRPSAPGSTDAAASTRPRSTAPPTPACSATRRRSASRSAASWPQRPSAARELFGESRLPTLVQYDPREPLLRGRTTARCCSPATTACRWSATTSPTTGGLIAVRRACSRSVRGTASTRCRDPPASDRGARTLPFVYVFGRVAFTVSYFGANVYPENVTVGLEQPPISEWVTGKFVLEAREDADRDRDLASRSSWRPACAASRRASRRWPSRSGPSCCG